MEAYRCWCAAWTSNPVDAVNSRVGGFDSHTLPPPEIKDLEILRIIVQPLCPVLWHRPNIWTILGTGSWTGNRLRQMILPTRTCNIVGQTMRIACGVKTKIGIVHHVDEEARGKFERDLLGGT